MDESVAEDGPYTPQGARERGLVDDVGYFDEARSALETAAGAVRIGRPLRGRRAAGAATRSPTSFARWPATR